MLFKNVCRAAAMVLALGSAVGSAVAAPIQLLTNGDFEAGSFAGWSTNKDGGSFGNLRINAPGAVVPLSGFPTAANSTGGTSYSVTDQTGPGAYALLQSFTVAPGTSSVLLSFQMFVNSYGSGPIFGNGLDYSGIANQHARVDILTAGAAAFDLGAAVLQNLYLGIDTIANNPNLYTNYVFDISALVASGGTFQIRFAEVDNQGFLNQGVDNVSILTNANANAVPEPASLALAGLALAAMALSRRRSRRSRRSRRF